MITVSIVKRAMDITLGTAFLMLSSPVMLTIAAAVKLTSKGPALYKQPRAGVLIKSNDEVPIFQVYKFRTMVLDAEKKTGATLSKKNDPRITKIGGFLRRTRLDELPQFLNVIKGEMSIVGPRPERPELMRPLNASIPFFEERLRFIKPGITGLAQIKLLYDGNLPKNSELQRLKNSFVNPYNLDEAEGAVADGMRLKLLYDLVYSLCLERFSTFIKTDLTIMIKTPLVMFLGKTGQ